MDTNTFLLLLLVAVHGAGAFALWRLRVDFIELRTELIRLATPKPRGRPPGSVNTKPPADDTKPKRKHRKRPAPPDPQASLLPAAPAPAPAPAPVDNVIPVSG